MLPFPNRWRTIYKTRLICVLVVLGVSPLSAQTTGQLLTIERCYQMALKNYPLIKQQQLITQTKDYTIANLNKGFLPALSASAQATYQSAVTNFPFTLPIPGFILPSYSKDQYKLYAEADQLIYDGGVVRSQKEVAKATEQVQQQNLELTLYDLYDRINQLYLGSILLNEQCLQNKLLQKDLQNGLDKVQALVSNGTAYRSSADELSAQLLQAEQADMELAAARKAYLLMLGLMIHLPPDANWILSKPGHPVVAAQQPINRPELSWYANRQQMNKVQAGLITAQLRPRISLFLQGGYGRPALNMLSNDFNWYYLGGLRLTWNLGGLYTSGNQKHLLDVNSQMIDAERETFLFNTQLSQEQQYTTIQKFKELLTKDDAIIQLRNAVKQAAGAQLENGVLSAHDYITQVDAADIAVQNRMLHEIQLLQAQYNYLYTTGNTTLP